MGSVQLAGVPNSWESGTGWQGSLAGVARIRGCRAGVVVDGVIRSLND